MFKSYTLLVGSIFTLLATQAYAGQRPPVNYAPPHTTCEQEADCVSVSVEDVDVLVFYDPVDIRRYRGSPTTYFQSWVDQVNEMYRNSGVGLRMNLVGVKEFNIDKYTQGSSHILETFAKNKYVNQQRDDLNADFASFVTSKLGTNLCGRGYLQSNAQFAFSIVNTKCGSLSFAHEIGHNMGLHHSRRQGDSGGTRYRYGLGYGVQGRFATIMAYPNVFDTDRIARFSNPKLHCAGGYACGVEAGNPDEADAVRALNNDRRLYSQFRVPYKNQEKSTVPTNGYLYTLQASHSNQCLTDGSQTQQQDCQNTPEQTWQLQAIKNNIYKLVNNKGQCLSLQDKQNYNGTALTTTACDNSAYQQWEVSPNKDEYTIKSIATGRYVEVQGASQQSGAIIDQWNYYNGNNQKWILNSI